MAYSSSDLLNWNDYTGSPNTMAGQDIGFGAGNLWPTDNSGSGSWWGSGDQKLGNQLTSLSRGLGQLKMLPDAGAAQRPGAPPPSLHDAQQPAMLAQYIDTLRQRQQALRQQFMPKTSGLLGG